MERKPPHVVSAETGICAMTPFTYGGEEGILYPKVQTTDRKILMWTSLDSYDLACYYADNLLKAKPSARVGRKARKSRTDSSDLHQLDSRVASRRLSQ